MHDLRLSVPPFAGMFLPRAGSCHNLTPGVGSRYSLKRRLSIRSEHGGALVEMALVMPVMLAMLTSIFSFSVVLYQKLQLGEAVSNAGRVMALERGDTDPCATTASSIYAAAPAL